ncbi:MAG: hypothetical protein JWR69_1377 [Pedosphaera sp.]|nr:hypothetical protein [Pedosphaera sp.]
MAVGSGDLGELWCIKTLPLTLKLLSGNMLILGRVKNPIAIQNHAKILTPRCNSKNSSGSIKPNLALWRTIAIKLDMPNDDSVVKVIKIWIRCRQNSPKKSGSQSNDPAKLTIL